MTERDVDNPVLQRLATRVRVLRAQHRWNQETLAELAGMHRTTIGQIERGTINRVKVKCCVRRSDQAATS